jgi:hypothetical protein
MSEYKGWKIECLEDLDIPKEWEDVSYNNDACPSYSYNGFQIWIAEKDNKLRELGKDSHRFHITHYNYYGDGYISKPFEDFNQVKNYVSNNFGAFIYIYK